MITSFPELILSNNIGGLYKFVFIPVADLVSSPDIFDNKAIGNHTFQSGKDWLSGYSDFQTAKLSIEYAGSGKGMYCKVSLNGSISDSSMELDALLKEMSTTKFVVIVIDNNKIQRIIGTKENGCQFTSKFATQAKYSDLPGYDFSFFFESACYPPSTTEISDIC